MASPSELVTEAFNNAYSYSAEARSQLTSFVSAFNNAIYAAPSISVTWSSLTDPTLPSLPAAPTLPTISFVEPTAPGSLTLPDVTISMDTWTETAPTLTIGTAPTLSFGAVPSVPSITAPTIPDAPTVTLPSAPSYIALSTPTMGTVDLHPEFLANLTNIPTLDLVAPTPFSYTAGPEYQSALLDNVTAKIGERLNGGTGLPAAVENAIWNRARDRETGAAQANIDTITRQSETLKFSLPAGVTAAQIRVAQQGYFDKLSELSRDVAIKQADLEQENLKQTISHGIELEGRLVDYSLRMEQFAFESAKELAGNAVQIYNSQVTEYNALMSGYQTYSSAYKTLIEGELSKVEIYKAQLQGEQSKAEINKTLVEQYKATIEASMASVEIYKSQVAAAQTLVQLEGARVNVAGEQIRAYVASVNAETSKVEAYKASIQAEATKVEVYKTKAQAFASVVGAQAEKARFELSRNSTLLQAKSAEWEGYRARVAAEGERVRALGAQSGALLDGYKAAATTIEAEARMHTGVWETKIREYEASQQLALQAGKINTDSILQTNTARLEAAKAGAQVYAQLTSSAYGIIRASAGVDAKAGTSVSYNYSNATTSKAPTITAV